LPDLSFDCATAQRRGRRDYQEDAIISSFPESADLCFVVLADGMGGHTAGNIASKIVVSEVFSELLFQSDAIQSSETGPVAVLRAAAQAADDCIAAHIRAHPECTGMGSTLIAPIILRGSLYWISIGDSPLLLYRDGTLQQLNEDHSLGPQIDYMLSQGLFDLDTARNHPDRNVLTSALSGKSVPRIDCPDSPLALLGDDILIVASDGLQFLDNARIERILSGVHGQSASRIAHDLLEALVALDDPDQDNISLSVIHVQTDRQACGPADLHHPAKEDRARRRAVG
jgi:PPM family protein phosphatase